MDFPGVEKEHDGGLVVHSLPDGLFENHTALDNPCLDWIGL